MGTLNKKLVKICGVVLATSIVFVAGVAVGALTITDQHYLWMRGNRAYQALETINILAKLRDGGIDSVIESLDRDAVLHLWVSSRNQWRHELLDMSKWDASTIKRWQEAKAYYEQHPEVLQGEAPSNAYAVKELMKNIPALERRGVQKDFSKIYTGKTPPALHIAEWIGPAATLEGLRGKVVLLDFWHIECPPCIASMPHTQELLDRFAGRGLEVLAIHSARVGNFKKVPEFLRTNQYEFSVGLDDGYDTEANYAVQAWPTYYLINKQGHLVWGPSHAVPSDAMLLELLDQER